MIHSHIIVIHHADCLDNYTYCAAEHAVSAPLLAAFRSK